LSNSHEHKDRQTPKTARQTGASRSRGSRLSGFIHRENLLYVGRGRQQLNILPGGGIDVRKFNSCGEMAEKPVERKKYLTTGNIRVCNSCVHARREELQKDRIHRSNKIIELGADNFQCCIG
jgi:hypothetical protein